MVHSALAGIDNPNINLAIIVFGLFAFHGIRHGIFIPELRLCYEAALIMVLNPKDQSLNPLDVHQHSENHPPDSDWSRSHRLCHFGNVGVAVQLSKRREGVEAINFDEGHASCQQ